MRVGYVLNKFPKISETFILHEMLELERQGVELSIHALDLPDEGRIHAGVSRLKASARYLRTGRRELAQLLRDQPLEPWALPLATSLQELLHEGHKDPFRILQLGIELALCARRDGVEAFHAHFMSESARVAAVAARLLGIGFSITCHAKDIYHESVVEPFVVRMCETASFVVTVCEANRAHLVRWLERPLERLRVVHNGIDLQFFHPRLRQPSASHRILSVGRLIEKKGFDDLLDACALLRDRGVEPECIIVGEGREREALQARAAGHGLTRVRFTGALTQDEVRSHMASATVLALPCVVAGDGNRDALPTVLLEAFGMGLPVVTTDVVGIPEILGPDLAHLLVPQREPSALADRLESVLNDREERGRVGGIERARAEQLFDRDRNVARLLELMRDHGVVHSMAG